MMYNPLFVVIVAAGASSRMNGEKKEFLTLPCEEQTVLGRSFSVFLNFSPARIIIVLPANDFETHKARARMILPTAANEFSVDFIAGGNTRRESVFNALTFLDSAAELSVQKNAVVLIHDGARPWIDDMLVERVLFAARQHGAACPAITPVDTLKQKNAHGFIERHLERASLSAAQTPQGFLFMPFLKAHQTAARTAETAGGKIYTDDTEIWDKFAADFNSLPLGEIQQCGCGAALGEIKKCVIVEGSPQNIKITYPGDINPQSEARAQHDTSGGALRVGLGCDTHRLVENRALVLGGVTIPFEKGEDGHSDGDVLLHAIIDALLGAAALGDIGSFFPPEDAAYKDADSRTLLATAWSAVTGAGWRLENLDCVIELEKPKFLAFRDDARKSIANILCVSKERVFVKAKTGEKMGAVGRGEAVKAWASCLLRRAEPLPCT